MLGQFTRPRLLGLLIGVISMALFAAACSGDAATPTTAPPPKEAVKIYTSDWSTMLAHTDMAGYIIENGYEYPVEYVAGTTGTMKVALPTGEMEVNMELWRSNIRTWYDEEIAAGTIVDLAGTGDNIPNGSKGQILENSGQGFYVPTYVVEANPGLVSIMDLPDYTHLFPDPEDPSKGVVINGIIGWQSTKIVQAKWFGYGLYDTYNIQESGTSGALDAAITGAYTAGDNILSYYWEPTTIVNELDLTRLEEPEWTQECQDAIDAAAETAPYESTMACAFPVYDVHAGVYSGLVERAPEVTEFLANFFVGALVLGDLEVWKNENDADWRDVTLKYLTENRDIWTTWITDANAAEIIANVDAALALDG